MTPEQIAELESVATAAAQAAEDANGTDEALNKAKEDSEAALHAAKEPSQDPVEQELARVKKPKTELEKAEAALFFNANRLRELGGEPESIIGVKKDKVEGKQADEIPEWYRKEQEKSSQKTAKELADAIEDPKERDLVLHHLENTVTSGNAEERVRIARGYVNSLRNAQIAEETNRGGTARRFNSAPGASARPESGGLTDLTSDEKAALAFKGMDGKPLLNEDDIRKARAASAEQ